MQFVVDFCPFVPAIRTDCQALITTAAAGTASATHHARPLARVWKRIAHSVGDNIADMVTSGKLVWIPAHKSHKAIGEVKKGDGKRLTAVDWRANRLVDALAKAAAADLQVPRKVAAFVRSAEAAAVHAACLLGAVTHAANHYKASQVADGGNSTEVLLRDSTDRPRFPARSIGHDGGVLPPVPTIQPVRPATRCRVVQPWVPPTPKVHANRVRRAASEGALIRRVEAIGATLAPCLNRPSAADRLSAIASRVRARSALHTLDAGACESGSCGIETDASDQLTVVS